MRVYVCYIALKKKWLCLHVKKVLVDVDGVLTRDGLLGRLDHCLCVYYDLFLIVFQCRLNDYEIFLYSIVIRRKKVFFHPL